MIPKKVIKLLELIYEQIYCIHDNIVVLYLPVLKRAGLTTDDMKLALEGLIKEEVVKQYNIRFALEIPSIPIDKNKKEKILKGRGWWFLPDKMIVDQYVIELSSRDYFLSFYDSLKKGNKKQPFGDLLSLHPKIYEKCNSLYVKDEYPEAVEKGFKVVKDRLRELTGYEKGSDAFGKGKLHIKGAAAINVDEDFNNAVKYILMGIDMFRNEKSHTSEANIDKNKAYEYLALSSLTMNLLDQAEIRKE